MTLISLLVGLSVSVAAQEAWKPPENPSPSKILQEARADARAKRYEEALAKHVWYHNNALQIEPAQTGLRLSFALSYWKELANQYPAAMFKLMEVREEAAAAVLANTDARATTQAFSDFVAINRTLGEEGRTKELFATLHKDQPAVAKQVYRLAQPALIKAKEYQLCSYYLEPDHMYRMMVMTFDATKRLAKDPKFGERQLDFANKSFTNGTTTLVALLAVNGRQAEAEKIAADAKKEWDDQAFHAAIDEALKGTVPAPWP